ncbi:uncharacterized protein LOC119069711 [Bradysia coprophila]|uniref:uncharacterized protein LOC119069711 n=1 Tax=Bradysia coprophila TaxID=38358 RepID=UPI00187D9BDB|nr:uncharacterized protein LOC119069711 [Bradysia coprophila]
MVVCEKFEKSLEKMAKNWKSIFKSAFRTLSVCLLWIAITIGFDWIFLSARPMRVDQIIFLTSAISVTILSWPTATSGSRFKRTSIEVLAFIFIEIAVFTTIIINVAWLDNYRLKTNVNHRDVTIDSDELKFVFIGFLAALSYIGILFPVMNAVMHSMLIYHFIRGTKKKLIKWCGVVRFFYCFLGIVVTIGIAFLIITQTNQSEDYRYNQQYPQLDMVLLLAQTTVFLVVIFTAIESTQGMTGTTVDKAALSKYFRGCRTVTICIQIVSILILVLEKTGYPSSPSMYEWEDILDLNLMSRIWMLCVCNGACFLRHFYLAWKIANPSANEASSDMRA